MRLLATPQPVAHDEACRRNDAVFDLLVRVLNCFMREAIKKKENASVFNVVYFYKALVRRLVSSLPVLGYSQRSASIGLTRVARRAGSQTAIKATKLNSTGTPMNTSGSRACTP